MNLGELQVNEAEQNRLFQLQAENQRLQAKLAASEKTIERLRQAYTNALEQLQLAKQRLFVAKAERHEAIPEQLTLEALLTQVESLGQQLDEVTRDLNTELPEANNATGGSAGNPRKSSKSKPDGRRDLENSTLPLVRVEILDPILEETAERIGFEDCWKLGCERGGRRRIQVAKAVYKITSESDESTKIVTAPAPKELFRRSLLAPELIARILVSKYVLGVPFARQESLYRLQGEGVDRATMCRYAEDAGATLGAIVSAMCQDAKTNAFCLATDATGIAIQPTPIGDGSRQPCRKGHFFVVLADNDHVFFEYQPKHTSKAVCEMFSGFTGYIQADANAVYDALFRGPPTATLWEETEVDPPPKEVGCYAHCRRNFWDAAVCKHPEGLIGLRLIDAIFDADRPLWKLPPAKRQQFRLKTVLPLVERFFDWVHQEAPKQRPRGLVSKALGYAFRQEKPLRRFLDDPRLRLENNSSERAIRPITVGRKNWLFCGSDDHANASANLFSLVASCKLHGLDPEAYLSEVMRVMPYFPRERYLELCPRDWSKTRARLNPLELAQPIGHITVPPLAAEK